MDSEGAPKSGRGGGRREPRPADSCAPGAGWASPSQEISTNQPTPPSKHPPARPSAPRSQPSPVPPPFSPHSKMSAIISRSALNAAPTVRSLASGAPAARGLNLAAAGAHDAHAHGATARTDFATVPKWAQRTGVKQGGLFARARVNGKFGGLVLGWGLRRPGGLGRKRWAVIGPSMAGLSNRKPGPGSAWSG